MFIGTDLPDYRIWVMESGAAEPSQQVAFVSNTYPQIDAN